MVTVLPRSSCASFWAAAKNLPEFYGILHYIQSVTSLSYKRDRCISFSLYVSQILWICVTVLPKIISTRVSGEVSDTLICCKRDRYMGFHIYVSRFKQILWQTWMSFAIFLCVALWNVLENRLKSHMLLVSKKTAVPIKCACKFFRKTDLRYPKTSNYPETPAHNLPATSPSSTSLWTEAYSSFWAAAKNLHKKKPSFWGEAEESPRISVKRSSE